MADIGTAFLRITPDTTGLNAQLVGYFQSSKFKNMGKAAGVALGAGLAAGGAVKGLYEIGQAFDEAYDKIRTQTGATGKELKGLEGDFKNVVSAVPADFGSAADAVAGLNQRLELTGKPLRSLSKQITELSRITGTDVQTNVQSVTHLFGDWSIKTGKQTETLDKLFRASQQTGIKIGDLSDLMVQFGSPLRQLGLDFDTAAAMFSKFEKEGVNIQTLMPGLRMALKNFSAPTDELSATFDKLGISLKDGPAAALQEVFEALDQAPSDLRANALAFEVFGARAGPDMAAAVREGRFELDDLLKTIEGGKDTIRDAAEDTYDFGEQWTRLKNNVFVALEPVASDVFGALGDEMERVTDILTDKRLTADEKFTKVFDEIGRVSEKVIPQVVENGVKIGTKLGEAILKGLLNLDNETKLNVVAIIGGYTAVSAAGTAAGKLFGKRFGVGMVVGLALIAPAFWKACYEWGQEHSADIKNAGSDAGEWFVNAMIDSLNLGLRSIKDTFDDGPLADFLSAAGIPNISELIPDDLVPQIGKVDFGHVYEGATKAQKPLEALIGTLGKVDEATKRGDKNWGNYAGALGKDLDKANRASDDHRKAVDQDQTVLGQLLDRGGDKIDRYSDRGGDAFSALTGKSGRMAKGVTGNVVAMVNTSSGGVKTFADNINEALSALKVKEKVSYSIKKAGKSLGNVVGMKQGGWLVPGSGDGDTVPLHIGGQLVAMVQPQEQVSVLNRPATAAAMAWNEKFKPLVRKEGGLVPRLKEGGSLMAPFNVDGAKPGFVPFMNFLNSQYGPLFVMSGLRPGSITTTGNVSNHATGHAVDISTHESGVEFATGPSGLKGPGAARMDALHSYMARNITLPGDFLWRTYTGGNHYNHIHRGITSPEADDPQKMIAYLSKLPGGKGFAALKRLILQGPDGPFKRTGQAGLDTVWRAGKAMLNRRAMTPTFGKGSGVTGEDLAGTVVKGRATWFTGGTMASGKNTDTDPGIALNPNPGGPDPGSWLNASTKSWLANAQNFLVKVGGKSAVLPVLDMGPAGWTGNAIDVDLAGVHKMGYAPSSFPSGTVGTAQMLKKHGGVVHLADGGKLTNYEGSGKSAIRTPIAVLQKSLKKLKALTADRGPIAMLDEKIARRETLDQLLSSEAGSELSAGEIARQVEMNQDLLGKLRLAARLAAAGEQLASRSQRGTNDPATAKRLKGLGGMFREVATEMSGITGKSGRVFDTWVHLQDLKGQTAAGSTGLDFSQLQSIIEARDFNVFAGLPKAHTGALINAPASQQVPIMARGQEAVVPLDRAGVGTPQVNITFADGMGWLKDFVEVEIKQQGVKAQNERYHGARARV